ncbi:MAG: M56 family metallopeptidase, partial [Clostridia bacterium]|nr:M56 family metallopeptidase [Clostridia bacterium]
VYTTETVKPAHGDILDSEGNIILEQHPAANGDILDSEGNVIVEIQDGSRTYPEKGQTHSWMYFFSRIWFVGLGCMLAYTAFSYYLLKRKVATAVPFKRGIKQSEYVDSPFVLGILRPVIYLPFGMAEADRAHVIAHEKAHIRRRDHWWKPIGFLLLSIYWFNPLLWVAYILLCRDIEAACDEKVIRDMDKDSRRAYSTALLNCSVHRHRIAACPLAFGETGVKQRVKGVMNYRKPAFWVILIALVITIIVAVCFLTNPKEVLPVTVDADYIGRNWADLKFILDDSYAEGEIQISDEYILEVQEQGMWREVENLSGKQPAQQVIDVQSDSADFDSWTSINWEEIYGRLPDGTFRLRKDVTINKDSDDSETQPIYVEFTIGSTTPSPAADTVTTATYFCPPSNTMNPGSKGTSGRIKPSPACRMLEAATAFAPSCATSIVLIRFGRPRRIILRFSGSMFR